MEKWGKRVKFAEKKDVMMDDSRRYPIGQQNFRELRRQGALYVDKTRYLEKIVNNNTQYWFLARPRRFGKSLFLSTLEYFYKGERDLFEGLFIDSIDWEWEKYPVLRLDLNNLRDITFSDDFADICGITEKELHEWFQSGIGTLAEYNGMSNSEVCGILKDNYDGYRFARQGSEIYNPRSVLSAMAEKTISNYWSLQGDPTIIAESLKNMDVDLEKTLNSRFRFRILAGMDLKNADPTALLYQTGYLTIKDYDFRTDSVTLGVPNREVKESLFEHLVPFYTKVRRGTAMGVVFDIIDDLRDGRPGKMVRDLDVFLSGVPYDMHMDDENNLHNAIYILLTLIGTETETEVRTSHGRIDLVVKTTDYIYIIELKFDKTAEEAMAQIKEKEYDLPYRNDGRRIFRIGVNFSSSTRHLDEPLIEEVQK